MTVSDDIETMLKLQTVAILGCSPRSDRPSHQIAAYLMDAGYRVIPVNPGCSEILGETCYPDLASVPDAIDVVDVFRRAEFLHDAAEQAVAKGAKGLWLQDGLRDPEAEALARKAGLAVVADDCIMRQHLSRFGR